MYGKQSSIIFSRSFERQLWQVEHLPGSRESSGTIILPSLVVFPPSFCDALVSLAAKSCHAILMPQTIIKSAATGEDLPMPMHAHVEAFSALRCRSAMLSEHFQAGQSMLHTRSFGYLPGRSLASFVGLFQVKFTCEELL